MRRRRLKPSPVIATGQEHIAAEFITVAVHFRSSPDKLTEEKSLEPSAMSTVTLEEAQTHLGELIARLQPGEEVVIAEGNMPVATLIRRERTSWPCKAGSAADKILWIAPDFDAPLEEFKEYME
jgi:antitoxin (DNA-binding transcriptional repressor) of toxin-antitoxin stability system